MNSESIFCLGEDVAKHSHTLLIARPAIEKFVLGTKYVESLDGLLERLDTLAFYINDLSKSFGLNSVDVFKLILSCNEVKEVLRPFAIYVNEIQNKVIADPRHKTLKPYLDLLLELLKKLEPPRNVAEEGKAETAKEMHVTYQAIHPMILPAVQKFISEARYLRSVEGFLERLDTLASHVTEVSKDLGLNPREVFKTILANKEVKEALEPLATYKGVIIRLVPENPRHKPLRPYLDILTNALESLPPSEKELAISRPSTQQIRQQEVNVVALRKDIPASSTSKKKRKKPRYETKLTDTNKSDVRYIHRSEENHEVMDRTEAEKKERKELTSHRTLPRNLIIGLYLIPLILTAINYVFAPWVTVRMVVEELIFEGLYTNVRTRISNYTFIYTGWDITYSLHVLISTFRGGTSIWIWLYVVGLVLATVALIFCHPLPSFFAGLTMCIGIYDFQNRIFKIIELLHRITIARIIDFEIRMTIHVMLAMVFGFYFLVAGPLILYISRNK